MLAAELKGVNQKLEIVEVPKPKLDKGEVLVNIKAAALNHRDNWIRKGKYAGLKFPIILGSDGAGIVVEVFNDADKHWISKEVVINPSLNWGGNDNFQGPDFEILGLPNNGTFAQFVKVQATQLFLKPNHLSFEQAAAFPLAGLTAFRALFTKANLQPNEKVLIAGVGGGAATFAMLWAINAGAQVYVTSSSDEKIKQAITLGAKGGVNYKTEGWADEIKSLSNGIDVIIDSALGDGFEQHFKYTNPGARIVFFGATAGDLPSLNPRIIFWKQIQILGTTMGNAQEFESMVEFINQRKIIPVVDQVFKLTDINEAFLAMQNAKQFGKIVLSIN
jgi:NADPH:quinone reductase-like Zn-dependent oxidoreductase